jgi:hypothetical protein
MGIGFSVMPTRQNISAPFVLHACSQQKNVDITVPFDKI